MIRIKLFLCAIIFCLFIYSCGPSPVELYVSTSQESSNVKEDSMQISTIDVYLETSISMKGYVTSDVSGYYPLKDVIPFLITDLKKVYDSRVQLFTITDESNIRPLSQEQFSTRLRKGNIFSGKSSKLQNIFSHVIKSAGKDRVNLLISDCIPDLKENILTEGSKITQRIYGDLIRNDSLGIVVFKYLSDFNGSYYYDRHNTGSKNAKKKPYYNTILKERPFYVWLIGNRDAVALLSSQEIIKNYQHVHSYNVPIRQLTPRILEQPKSGKISINVNKNSFLLKEADTQRPAKFVLGFDIRNQPDPLKSIMTNLDHYSIAPEYYKEVVDLEIQNESTLLNDMKKKTDFRPQGHSHFLKCSINDFDPQFTNISFNFFQKEPKWILDTNLSEDVGLPKDSLSNRTFGFKFISNAFKMAHPSEEPIFQIHLKQENK